MSRDRSLRGTVSGKYSFKQYLDSFRKANYDISTRYIGFVVDDETICYVDKMNELIKKEHGEYFFETSNSLAEDSYPNRIIDKINRGEILNSSEYDSAAEYLNKEINLRDYFSKKLEDISDFDTTVEVRTAFVVEIDGTISNTKIRVLKRSNDSLFINSINKALLNMLKWRPASYEGIPVRSLAFLPITFKVDQD